MADDNIDALFQRRERRVSKPLHRPALDSTAVGTPVGVRPEQAEPPPAPPVQPTWVEPQPEMSEVAPVQEAAPTAVRPRRVPLPRREALPEPVLEAVDRHSIFLTHTQGQWLMSVRGRLLVEGKDISASEVVRLALDRLRSEELTDAEMYRAAKTERARVRGPGRPAQQRGQ